MIGKRWIETAVAVIAGFVMAVAPGSAGAQEVGHGEAVPEKVAVGDGVVDGSFIRGYESHFRLERRTGDGGLEPWGRWSDELRVAAVGDGARVIKRWVARWNAADEKDLERWQVVEHETLAPVRLHSRLGPGLHGFQHLEYDGAKIFVTVMTDPTEPRRSQELTLDVQPYDLGLWGLILASAPLEEGFRARLPVVGPGGVAAWETLVVEGREEVTVDGGATVNAWVVSTRDIFPWTGWVTKEPPYIHRAVQRLPDGSEVISIRTSSVAKE